MGYFAITVISLIALGEAYVIYALLNRVLIQAHVAPIHMPQRPERQEAPEPIKAQPIFRVPFMG